MCQIPIIGGVPYKPAALACLAWGYVFMASGTHIYVKVCALVGMVLTLALFRAGAAYDPNIFRLVHIWGATKGRASRNARYWGGSSSSPLPATRPRSAKQVQVHV
jgi:type IV secretory pathway VirB3-like protein